MRKKKVNKTALAKELAVSRSSLYYQGKMELKDQILKDQILSTLEGNPAYGHRRIALHLKCNKKRVLRVMKRFNIIPLIQRGKTPCKPNDVGRKASNYCNYLKHLCPLKTGVLWASDFTYLKYYGQFYFLATTIDVVSREIVGIAFSPFHNKELVMEALLDALSHYPPPSYLHSDQGSEYNSEAYVNLAKKHNILISMSGKGKPWENGFQESFYSQFKLELGSIQQHQSLGELVEAIYLQIHYYNHDRIHTALKMPPKVYAKLHSRNRDKLF